MPEVVSTSAQPSMPPWPTEPPDSARKAHWGNDSRRSSVADAVVGMWWFVVTLAACQAGLPSGRFDDVENGQGADMVIVAVKFCAGLGRAVLVVGTVLTVLLSLARGRGVRRVRAWLRRSGAILRQQPGY